MRRYLAEVSIAGGIPYVANGGTNHSPAFRWRKSTPSVIIINSQSAFSIYKTMCLKNVKGIPGLFLELDDVRLNERGEAVSFKRYQTRLPLNTVNPRLKVRQDKFTFFFMNLTYCHVPPPTSKSFFTHFHLFLCFETTENRFLIYFSLRICQKPKFDIFFITQLFPCSTFP